MKDELTLKEKEVLQSRIADTEFFNALDHFLSIERDSWRQKMMNAAKAGADSPSVMLSASACATAP